MVSIGMVERVWHKLYRLLHCRSGSSFLAMAVTGKVSGHGRLKCCMLVTYHVLKAVSIIYNAKQGEGVYGKWAGKGSQMSQQCGARGRGSRGYVL